MSKFKRHHEELGNGPYYWINNYRKRHGMPMKRRVHLNRLRTDHFRRLLKNHGPILTLDDVRRFLNYEE